MKKLAVILGSVLLVGVLVYPVFAHGPGWGWGRGHHMMGYGGGGPGYCWQDQGNYGNLTQDQQKELDRLNQKFFNENASLRNDIWEKSTELNYVLNASNPDAEKAGALQKQISELRSKMAQNRLQYILEARKIVPAGRYGGGYGWGYGPHMRGYGSGPCGY